jgi:hypothetical protein
MTAGLDAADLTVAAAVAVTVTAATDVRMTEAHPQHAQSVEIDVEVEAEVDDVAAAQLLVEDVFPADDSYSLPPVLPPS